MKKVKFLRQKKRKKNSNCIRRNIQATDNGKGRLQILSQDKKKKKGERKKKREVKATWQTCGIIPIPVVRSQNSRAQTQG